MNQGCDSSLWSHASTSSLHSVSFGLQRGVAILVAHDPSVRISSKRYPCIVTNSGLFFAPGLTSSPSSEPLLFTTALGNPPGFYSRLQISSVLSQTFTLRMPLLSLVRTVHLFCRIHRSAFSPLSDLLMENRSNLIKNVHQTIWSSPRWLSLQYLNVTAIQDLVPRFGLFFHHWSTAAFAV